MTRPELIRRIRDARIAAGKCEDCGRPREQLDRRKCDRHLSMRSARTTRANAARRWGKGNPLIGLIPKGNPVRAPWVDDPFYYL